LCCPCFIVLLSAVVLFFCLNGRGVAAGLLISHGDRGAYFKKAEPQKGAGDMPLKGQGREAARPSPPSSVGPPPPTLTLKVKDAVERGEIDERGKLHRAASSYVRGGDYYSAIKVYKKILSVKGQDYRVMNQVAVLYMRLHEWEDAMDFITQGLGIRGGYAPLLINAGIVSVELGRSEAGEIFLQKALLGEGSERLAFLNLAILYEARGDKTNALKYYVILNRLGDNEGRKGIKRIAVSVPRR